MSKFWVYVESSVILQILWDCYKIPKITKLSSFSTHIPSTTHYTLHTTHYTLLHASPPNAIGGTLAG